jgi:hypothetical protein
VGTQTIDFTATVIVRLGVVIVQLFKGSFNVRVKIAHEMTTKITGIVLEMGKRSGSVLKD